MFPSYENEILSLIGHLSKDRGSSSVTIAMEKSLSAFPGSIVGILPTTPFQLFFLSVIIAS